MTMLRLRGPLVDVLIFRGAMPRLEDLATLAGETGCLVIHLDDDQTVEALDEAEMHAAGWIRCGQ